MLTDCNSPPAHFNSQERSKIARHPKGLCGTADNEEDLKASGSLTKERVPGVQLLEQWRTLLDQDKLGLFARKLRTLRQYSPSCRNTHGCMAELIDDSPKLHEFDTGFAWITFLVRWLVLLGSAPRKSSPLLQC